MHSSLDRFFQEERKRVIEPGPFFTQRVLARLETAPRHSSLVWDFVPRAVRPVMVLALTVLFAVLLVRILVPVEPSWAAMNPYAQPNASGQTFASGQIFLENPQSVTTEAQFEEMVLLGAEP